LAAGGFRDGCRVAVFGEGRSPTTRYRVRGRSAAGSSAGLGRRRAFPPEPLVAAPVSFE
jgi:hypothetical protein